MEQNKKREVEYRAWDKDKKKMVYNFPVRFGLVNSIFIDNHLEFMQYTGRKDRNGKKIYEGDITNNGIVRWYDDLNWESGGSIHPGFWFERKGMDNELIYWIGFNDCEIIGNIYDNPELINYYK